MKPLTHFSLFSGIGGIDLAAEWAGFETVGQCEFADYPTKVLEKHWPDVPRWRDIRSVTADSFRERTGRSAVDLISGGFPCQPFSVAGNQKGKSDDRYLWPEMLRVIRELKPRWVLGENVSGIIKIAGRTVCEDLEREGYDVAVFNFEAAAVGAPHRRERVFFVGNAKHDGLLAKSELRSYETASNEWRQKEPYASGELAGADRPFDVSGIYGGENGGQQAMAYAKSQQNRRLCQSRLQPYAGTSCTNVAYSQSVMPQESVCADRTRIAGFTDSGDVSDTDNEGLQVTRHEPRIEAISTENRIKLRDWWTVEPDVGRVANGIPARVDRLKCLGNAVVPQQVYPILQAIADVETNT